MDVHVDEARRDDGACRFDDLGIGRRREMLADLGDEPVAEQDVADRIESLHRIDDASAANEKRLHEGRAFGRRRGGTRFRAGRPSP
ncbi:MAG: hypothetical protein NVSMB21_15890 [Vulcanimicrobiaceae bacterium]